MSETIKPKKLIIDYKKHWGPSGTVYSQTIKISEDLQKKYNNRIRYLKNKVNKKIEKEHVYNYDDMKILSYTDTLRKGVNYTHLTGLFEFQKMIEKIGLHDKRLHLSKNTIIEVL